MIQQYYKDDLTRIYHGDCFEILPGIGNVDIVITDPPYSSGGMMRGDRMQSCQAKYQSSETIKTYPEFTGDTMDQYAHMIFTVGWLKIAYENLSDGGLICIFTDWRQLPVLCPALQVSGYVWRGIAVWDKTEAARPQKGRPRNQCEFIVWGTKGPRAIEGRAIPGCYRQSVFREKKKHITEKPVGVMRWLLGLVKQGETVLDPFMGSGTTLRAAKELDMKSIGIEKLKKNCDIAVSRLKQPVQLSL